ncbi:hypothetical protein KW803_03760, partial [Candidatus Saccharibacteria bacterium]|nr:hypothetical protein [Candidatus Saccharibacteria bacterium]
HLQPPQPVHHRPVPVTEPVVVKKARRKPNLKIVGVIAGMVVFLSVAGYFAFKPSKPKVIMPADLAKQASFKFYYPSPMPGGYHYNTSQGTFQNGSAYYMLMNGGKHIVVTQTSSVGNTSLGKLADSTQFKSPVGNVVLGTEINQTSAYVLAGDTLISIHSYGRIPKDEMTNVINSFKQLGQPAG